MSQRVVGIKFHPVAWNVHTFAIGHWATCTGILSRGRFSMDWIEIDGTKCAPHIGHSTNFGIILPAYDMTNFVSFCKKKCRKRTMYFEWMFIVHTLFKGLTADTRSHFDSDGQPVTNRGFVVKMWIAEWLLEIVYILQINLINRLVYTYQKLSREHHRSVHSIAICYSYFFFVFNSTYILCGRARFHYTVLCKRKTQHIRFDFSLKQSNCPINDFNIRSKNKSKH